MATVKIMAVSRALGEEIDLGDGWEPITLVVAAGNAASPRDRLYGTGEAGGVACDGADRAASGGPPAVGRAG